LVAVVLHVTPVLFLQFANKGMGAEFPFKLFGGDGTKLLRKSFGVSPIWSRMAEGISLLMISRAADYRRYAAECLRLAQIISNPTEKGVLLQMAETWRRLANEIESRNPSTDDEEGTSL